MCLQVVFICTLSLLFKINLKFYFAGIDSTVLFMTQVKNECYLFCGHTHLFSLDLTILPKSWLTTIENICKSYILCISIGVVPSLKQNFAFTHWFMKTKKNTDKLTGLELYLT
jgi:hypothetical protein